MQQNSNGTVYLSLMKTDCVAGQSATQLPVKGTEIGAAMVLEPTCKQQFNFNFPNLFVVRLKNTCTLFQGISNRI
jgi:hypothetical protein